MEKIVQKKLSVIVMSIFALLSVALVFVAITKCDSEIWQLVLVAPIAISTYIAVKILKNSYEENKMKIMKISMLSSFIMILPVMIWCLTTLDFREMLFNISGAMLFAALGLMGIFSVDQPEEKSLRALICLFTIFLLGAAFSFLYEAVKLMVILPNWVDICANILCTLAQFSFILFIGLGAALIWKAAKNASYGIYLKLVSIMAWFIFFGISISAVFDLLGLSHAIVGQISEYGIVITFGGLLLTGICHFVAYLCNK